MNSAAILAFQAVPAAPGAQAPGAPAPAPAVSQPTPGPESAPPGGLIGGLLPFLIFVPLIALLFWQSRSQQKKQQAAIAGLKKGDKVVTQGGIVGRLAEMDSHYVRVEVAPGVKIQVLRSHLTGRDTGDVGTASKDAATKDSAKDKDAESGGS